ncbi:MAG: NAD(P)/FAD-dependent oxidoreductase [Campylobacterota bacterium]
MKHVVILGGGYAGIYALRELAGHKDIKITLIDKHSYHNMQPEVYDFIANKTDLSDVTIDLSTLCAGFDHDHLAFLNARVTDIDFAAKTLETTDEGSIQYDYLLLGIGARTAFPKTIEGLNNSDDLKKLHKALEFKQDFEQSIFKRIEQECKKCEPSHIVVAGGGLSGVEVAAEMAHFAKKFLRGGLFACESMKITLISGSGPILKHQDQRLVARSQKRLNALGVNTISGARMSGSDKEYVHLDNGAKLPYSFLIFAGGIEAANLTSKLKVEKNSLGQLYVDRYQKVPGVGEVFAAGDACVIKDENDQQMPPNVTVARESGIIAAKNILASINEEQLCECKPFIEGTLVALGGRYAACDLYGKVFLGGFLGHLIKHYVFWRYKFPLQRISRRGYRKLKAAGFSR